MIYLFIPIILTVSILIFSMFDDHYTKLAFKKDAYQPFFLIRLMKFNKPMSFKLVLFKGTVYATTWIILLFLIIGKGSVLVSGFLMALLGVVACIMLLSLLHNIEESQ